MTTQGNRIMLTNRDDIRRIEGVIKTGITPKPGTVMQIDISAGFDANNKLTLEYYDADADGARPHGPLLVLEEDRYQGKLMTAAYAAGDPASCVIPEAGDILNMLLQDVAGTGDAHSAGELLIVDKGTGELIATTGTPESEPFMLFDALAAPTADTLARVVATGY